MKTLIRMHSTATISFLFLLTEITLVHPTWPISLDNFTPFGEDNGDISMSSRLDAISDKNNITTAFPFFGRKFTSLYVSSHGVISFEKVFASYRPKRFPLVGNFTIIAPFWADVARRYIGGIFYRQNNSQYLLEVASIDVRKAFPGFSRFSAIWMFVATWEKVPFFGSYNNYHNMTKNITNTFQAVLLTDGRYSFVRLNYHNITWTTGTTSGGNPDNGLGGIEAGCGFNAGFGNHSYNVTFNKYRSIGVLDLPFKTNVNKSGVWMFRTDDITIQEPKRRITDVEEGLSCEF
ncbi:Sushi, nidogen and EGF-like domain-containing protein 1 [Exaiptasia diaphana]|nr:Sushi, nidogen and EGF-like domain-containing protein 1 [Exaiptasia diaphana]